jgi:hypothetical protein
LIGLLQKVVDAGGHAIATVGRVTAAVERLEEIRQREQNLDVRISSDRRRLRKLKSLALVFDYDEILKEQTASVVGVPRARQDSRADRMSLSFPRLQTNPAYSTVTINLLKPRRMLFRARSSASIWKRVTLRASAVNSARISSLARFMPRHVCGPAPNAM